MYMIYFSEHDDSVAEEAEKNNVKNKKEIKFEFKIGRSPPGMDPKKDDNDKKKKKSSKEGFEGFDGEPKYQYGFFGLLAAIALSYIYEGFGMDFGDNTTMNTFLNVSFTTT